MEFLPLYYAERLRVVNPHGSIGIVTLWSKVEALIKILTDLHVDLGYGTSKVGVVANLYGNGLPQMLRNLLYNPQITHLVVCGQNLSGSREHLLGFFENGLEESEFLGAPVYRIVGSDKIIDGEVKPEHFLHKPSIKVFGEISSPDTKDGIKQFLEEFQLTEINFKRIEPPQVPAPTVTRFPSNGSANIERRTPIEAWQELVFCLYRFGHRNTIRKSSGHETRIELRDVKVTVHEPSEESASSLEKAGFRLGKFQDYQIRILDPQLPADARVVKGGYAYGWLLRTGMEEIPVDSLQIISERMREDNESRHCYATLWNNGRHLPAGKGCPCFVTAFFRKFEGKLEFTATFRAHNAMDAWLENFYGLMAIQRYVAERINLPVGPIRVISHSISLDPDVLDRARIVVNNRISDDDFDQNTGKYSLRMDPNGEFTVTFDRSNWELVVEHSYQGQKIGEYRGRTPEIIETQLSRDRAISLVSHALYLGRELARKENEMRVARSAKAT